MDRILADGDNKVKREEVGIILKSRKVIIKDLGENSLVKEGAEGTVQREPLVSCL